MPDQPVVIPEALSDLSDAQLTDLLSQANSQFDALLESDDNSAEAIARLERLAEGIERLQAEGTARATQASERETKRAELRDRLRPAPDPETAEAETPDAPEAQADETEPPAETPEPVEAEADQPDPEALAAAAADRMATAFAAAMERVQVVREPAPTAAQRLAEARRNQPAAPVLPDKMAMTAGADIRGVARGSDLPDLDALVEAVHARARSLPATSTPGATGYDQVPGAIVATGRNEFEHSVEVRGDVLSAADFEELHHELTSKDKVEALVAGGGWCAPSEIRYSFFESGDSVAGIDLPTFGVNRGGIQFPVSPSLADVFSGSGGYAGPGTFSNATNPWLWSETDDVLTVTGSPNKPCIRIPCPSFTERRLELWGLCVTAGNLANDAYPEVTRNFLRLLNLAFDHATNERKIAQMVSLSSAIVTGGDYADDNLPVYQQVYGAAALAATDYRTRYGLSQDTVLEVVYPQWIREMVRSDLAWRNGVDLLDVDDPRIMQGFARRRIRPQFVDDWQVRTTGKPGYSSSQTAWPTTVDFLLYQAGTFLLGNGMSLDLGVVRDSVLNAENDYTAAWMEEAHLVAKVGHESRQYRVAISVNGATGPQISAGDNL